MNLTRVEVSNFKGIDSLAFEPGQVTLLTGRNNSGKTSLLEAVELAVDPSRIEQYGERVESLIAAGAESAEIVVEYKNGGDVETRALELWVPEEVDEAALIADLVARHEMRDISHRAASIVGSLDDGMEEGELLDIFGLLENSVEASIRDGWDSQITTRMLEISVNGQPCTFFNLVEIPPQFVSELAESAVDDFTSSLSNTLDSDTTAPSGDFERETEQLVENLLHHVFGDGHLSPEDPQSLASVGFRDELALTADEIDLGENDGAIRLSNIEEYLIDNGLAENLDTLSLDQMVYEEDGGKYQVPYEFVGEGFKTLLGLLWELWEDTPELLLLEEPETHMHPRYVHEFVHWFVDVVRDRGVQVFLTTHDIDTIRSFFDFVEPSQKAFLREEFRLLQMDQTLPESYDYDEAESLSKELQTDLRGI